MDAADGLYDEDFRFRMGIRPGDLDAFFGPRPSEDPGMQERRLWLERDPSAYCAIDEAAGPLLDDAISLACSAGAISPETREELAAVAPLDRRLARLGALWLPDFLILDRSGADSPLVLRAGCVCFPSSWSLPDKVGSSVETIHGIVPSLNSSIGRQIRVFLERLRPGVSWERANWGLSRSGELNQHPARGLPRLDSRSSPEEVWRRVEHQSLTRLSATGGILFGIRVETEPLSRLKQHPPSAKRLARALRTMPDDVARYKGILEVRPRVIQYLETPS